MGPTQYELLGMAPVDENGDPLIPKPPIAQIDFTGTGDGWGGHGFPALIAPSGDRAGFGTAVHLERYQGSLVFDSPGTWLAIIGEGEACFSQFPVEVLPVPD